MIFGYICSLFFNLFSIYEAQGVCNILLHFPANETPLFPNYASRTVSGNPLLMTDLNPYFEYPNILSKETQSITITGPKALGAIACPGSKNSILNIGGQVATSTCLNKKLMISGQKSPLTTVSCKKQPAATIIRTQRKCHGEREGVYHIIGWQIDPKWFIPQITVCWDPVKETTLYSRHVIYGSSLKKRVMSPGRPSFKAGNLFSHKIADLYSKSKQLEKLRPLLGAVRSIPGTGNYYFARGHLAPDADFITPAEQDATYYYANVIPKFQDFNNGNWKSVEYSVRELAEKRSHSLVVYTGTMGVLSLKDDQGNRNSIHLFPKGNFYPVPLVIWKVVHDPIRKEAIAILGLNFVQKDNEILNNFFSLCDDICPLLKWSTWESKEYKKGSILCCSWSQFKLRVPKLMDLGNVKVLNN